MASQAEIDLVVDASDTLRDLQRDLDRVVAAAQANTNPVTVQAVIDGRRAVADMSRQLDIAVRAAQASADDIDIDIDIDVDVDTDRASRGVRRFVPELNDLTRVAGSAAGALGSLGAGAGIAGAGVGAAVPLVAGLVAAVESILPASAVATQGMLSMALVSGTLKLGMLGVGDAIETAFDPEATPEDLAEALKQLAPEAKKFVTELTDMKREFKELQLDVQNRLFKNFDESLKSLSRSALPQVGEALGDTADSLNRMGRGAASAAADLASDGTLGIALKGATRGIENFAKTPGQAVTAFGQLAAAAAPAFDRITEAAARAGDSVSSRLTAAFESGGLEDAINGAIDVIAQLGRIAGNVFGTLGNVISGVSTEGEGLFGTLEKVTQAMEDASASPEFQKLLTELSKTMSLLAATAIPLLVQALGTVSSMITILAPYARELIDSLGGALGMALEASREPLEALATAFGETVEALLPFIELAGELVSELLPVLTPIFEELGKIVAEMAPFFAQLAENIAAQLVPILERLPEVVGPIMEAFTELAQTIMPMLTQILIEIQPSLLEMATALGDMLVELTPLITEIIKFVAVMAEDLLPIIGPVVVGALIILTSTFQALAEIIGNVVMPAIRGIAALLNGDGTSALKNFGDAAQGMRNVISGVLTRLLGDTGRSMVQFVDNLQSAATTAWNTFKSRAAQGAMNVVQTVRNLPSQIRGAIGDMANLLRSAGASLIQGLINGITSKISSLVSTLGSITDMIPNLKGPAARDARLLTPNGELIMDGLIAGFESKIPDLQASLGGITSIIPQSVATMSPDLAVSSSPVVFVTIGNEAVDRFVTTRVEQAQETQARTLAQGVRR